MIYCMKCGKEVSDEVTYCPYCGEKLKNLSAPAEQENAPLNEETATTDTTFSAKAKTLYKTHPKRFIAVIAAIFLAILAAIIIPIAVSNSSAVSSLDDREQKCYKLVVECSYEFKNPKSVRIVSGTLNYYPSVDEDYFSAYLRLSATNGYGATTTGNYFLGYDDDGSTFCIDLDYLDENGFDQSKYIQKCKVTDDFDVNKVNIALEQYWKNY